MKIKYTATLMFLWSFYNMTAQNNFSVDLDLKTMPTSDIKINEAGLLVHYNTKWNDKYALNSTLELNTKSIHYVDGNLNSTIDLTRFNRINIPFTFTYRLNKKIQLNFQAEPFLAYATKINFENVTFLGGIDLDYTITAKNTIALGLRRTAIFGEPSCLPAFTYRYEPDKKWQLNLGFPETKIVYAYSPFTAISIQNSFNGNWYTTDIPGTKASFSQISTSLQWQQNMDTNWYINIKVGYDFNRKYVLMDNHYRTTYDFNINNGYHFGITIKYKY